MSADIALLLALFCAGLALAQTPCGPVRGFDPLAGGRFAVAATEPSGPPAFVFVLLPSETGLVDLDGGCCPRALSGNSPIRAIAEFVTGDAVAALVDAPAEWRGLNGVSTSRIEPVHADPVGVAIKALRETYRVPVWFVGTSRGGDLRRERRIAPFGRVSTRQRRPDFVRERRCARQFAVLSERRIPATIGEDRHAGAGLGPRRRQMRALPARRRTAHRRDGKREPARVPRTARLRRTPALSFSEGIASRKLVAIY
ncbi:MAG: hypothetical protein ACKOEE_17090 [Tagaea sp.]